jgi:ribonuclease VapC
MIVDASAFIAVLKAEPDAGLYAQAVRSSRIRRISAVNFVEASIAIDGGRNPVTRGEFDDLFLDMGLTIELVTEEQARIARDAYRDYGRGSEHPAKLNFGDCFAYALAKTMREPLLYKGNDFVHTDIKSALDPT